MKFKIALILLSAFSLTGCITAYMISDEEAFKLGKEEKMTMECLSRYSNISDLKNISNLPDVGIGERLKFAAKETIGGTVFGQGRYNFIKRDYIFHKSVENHMDIINKARIINIQPNFQECKLYVEHYENIYRTLKYQGF